VARARTRKVTEVLASESPWPGSSVGVAEMPWLRAPWMRFLSMHRQGRLPHGLLVTGASGLGALNLAREMAAYLLCAEPITTPGAERACGECASCRLRLAGTHPDIQLLIRDGANKDISVDDIRTLIESFSLTRYGPLRVALIEQAERMNRSAANGLLKLLEEPPPGSLFLMTAERADLLPSTIRSRIQRLAIPLPHRATLIDWLIQRYGLSMEEAELLWFIGDDQLMDGSPPSWDWQLPTTALVHLMTETDQVLPVVKQWQTMDRDVLARWLMRLWVEVMRVHSGLSTEAPAPLQPLIQRLVDARPKSHWLKVHRVLLEFLQSAKHPLNEELALDRLALDLIAQDLPSRLA
jgi:DNA polymerase III subunit delta'